VTEYNNLLTVKCASDTEAQWVSDEWQYKGARNASIEIDRERGFDWYLQVDK
jgi:hypothetical protein